MNIVKTILDKIAAKYTSNASNCTIFKNILGGACPARSP